MIGAALIAGLIAAGAYWWGLPLWAWGSGQISCFDIGLFLFLLFSYNMARAEIGELKLILDEGVPNWREDNALWTSTWDWNRQIKRRLKREERRKRWARWRERLRIFERPQNRESQR